jgi:putative hemolysin
MATAEIVYLIVFVFCVMASAFFAVSEIAFIALQRFKLEHLLETRAPGASTVQLLVRRPDRLLSTVLLGNNLVNTSAAALGTILAEHHFGSSGAIISIVGVTVILLIFADTIPKTATAHHAETVALKLAPSVRAISLIFSPVVWVLSWIARTFGKLVGARTVGGSLISPEEIRTMINVGRREGSVEKAEAEMLHKVFEFGDRPAREIMVPRTEVIWVEKGMGIVDFFKLYIAHPLNRYPVYLDSKDNVLGIISSKDVLLTLAKGTCDVEKTIDELIRPVNFAPESKRISELLAEMRDQSYHMCIIIDEYGSTSGILTLTQLVEEIVGDVKDELAEVNKDFEIIDESNFQIDGAMRIEDANQQMNLGLPEGDYDTVAGFALKMLGHIPKTGEQIKYKDLKLAITRMEGRKIEEILVTRDKKNAATANPVQPGS